MRTPRMPHISRDRLPQIGESPESVENEVGEEASRCEDSWEEGKLETNGSVFDDTSTESTKGVASDGRGHAQASIEEVMDAAAAATSAEASSASRGTGPAVETGNGAGEGEANARVAEEGLPPASGRLGDVNGDKQEPEIRIKTLKDYVGGRSLRSPRGLAPDPRVDLEQIKASPRSEDLTKINFARFHFNGVDTTLLDLKTKNLNGHASGEDTSGVEDADLHILIAAGVLPDSQSADSTPREGGKAGSRNSSADKKDTYRDSPLQSTDNYRKGPSRSSSSREGPALDVLSSECISRVGVGSVGKEYTSMLKVLGKRLDLALRQGLNVGDQALGSDIQESQHAARHRWESVQRLSAILHEVHDAEVGLSLAEAKQQVIRESGIWEEESALLASQHDALLKRAQWWEVCGLLLENSPTDIATTPTNHTYVHCSHVDSRGLGGGRTSSMRGELLRLSILSALIPSAYVKREPYEDLEVAERRVCAEFSEQLLQKLTSTTQSWANASFERQATLVKLFETDLLRNEEDIMKQHSSTKALRNLKVAAQVSSAIHNNTSEDGHRSELDQLLSSATNQFLRSQDHWRPQSPGGPDLHDMTERGISPALVLSKNSVRAAYEQGNGSLPIQFSDADAHLSPRSIGHTQQDSQRAETKALAATAPPAEYNFIPDTLVSSDAAGRAAQSLESTRTHRRGFGPSEAVAALANREVSAEQRQRATDSSLRFLF